MQLFQHGKKLAKLRIKLSFCKPLWKWQGGMYGLGGRIFDSFDFSLSRLSWGSLSLGNGATPLCCSFLLLTSSLTPLGPSSCVSLLSTMALHYSLGFCLDLLCSLVRGVINELACWAIYVCGILLWVVNESTLEASCLMYSSCFYCTRSTLSTIILG